VAEKPTVTAGPWPLGIDNRSPDYAVPADALRNAVNVDLSRDGHVQRRQGYARIVDVLAPHSLYTCPAGTFFASQGTLYTLNSDNTTTAVLSGLLGSRVTYEYFNDIVYLSDGVTTKRLLGGVVPMDWGIPRPTTKLTIQTTSGDLHFGTFTAAASFINSLGEESALGPISQITTNVNSGFILGDFPNPASADITHIRLYFSGSGSTTLYHIADVAIGTASYTVTERVDTGKAANLRVFAVPPASNIIRHHAGRMYLVVGSTVFYTEPYAFNWVDPVKSFWQFPETISVFEPIESGAFIIADKTYFYRFKDPDDTQVVELLDYGAIPHTSVRLPHGEGVMWQSLRGTIMGDENGTVKNIQEERAAADTASTGAAFLREQNGTRQFVASLPNSTISPLSAKSFMEAEIIRRGS